MNEKWVSLPGAAQPIVWAGLYQILAARPSTLLHTPRASCSYLFLMHLEVKTFLQGAGVFLF